VGLLKPWPSPEVVEEILQIGLVHAPLEVCGIICPDMKVVQLQNTTLLDPTNHYEVSADEVVEVIADYIVANDIVEHQLSREYFILWHTHPSGFIGPSKGDLDYKLEHFQYLVVTLPGGEAALF
jgi:proteasome lid subunit RPN8/RPN11